MLSLKKLCSHDDSFYNFSIRDNDGKLLLRINGGISRIKLKDFLKEMRKQVKETISIEPNFLFRNHVGEYVLINTQIKLEKTLEFTKYFGSTPIYLFRPLAVHAKIAEIFVECKQCCGNKKKYNDPLTLSNKTNLKFITSKQKSEIVENVKEYFDEFFYQSFDENETCHQNTLKSLRIPSTQEKLGNNLHKKQKESKDIKVLNQLNDSSTVPPPWFKEYMETMKNDMVHKITHEVTKKVTKKLTKHLDLFKQCIPNEQSQPRYISSPLERNLQFSFESIEKKQDQKKFLDEEQSSDVSIERIKDPQNADTVKDVQVTKNESSTVNSKKIMKDITEMLNKTSVNPIMSVPSKKHEKSGNSIKKNHRETPQIEEQLNDTDSKFPSSRKKFITKKAFQEKLYNAYKMSIENEFMVEKRRLKEKINQRDAQVATNNLENDAKSQGKSDENSVTTNPKFQPVRSADWKPGKIENGFHMSCSVTGHQMLDENVKEILKNENIKDLLLSWGNDANDINKNNFCSYSQEENDDDSFEIIQMPTSEDGSFTRRENSVVEQQQHDSNRDSPSFEILTEPSSPCSIYIAEDHFATNEGKSEEDSQSNNNIINNNSTNCDEYQPEFESIKSTNTDLEKLSGGAYSFVTETLPAQDFNSCKSLHAKQQSNEVKYSQDDGRSLPENTCGLYGDVRNSHTSYLTHCNCHSQCTNLNDLTQSFHSHTTSISDITDVSHRLANTDNSHSSQMPSTNAQDAGAIPKNNLEPHVDIDRVRTRMNVLDAMEEDNYSKCRASTPQDAFTDNLHQCHRANGFTDKSSPNAGSRKTFPAEQPSDTADFVHILPETLVIAAVQVGSYAYDTARATAREVFDRIRAHTEDY